MIVARTVQEVRQWIRERRWQGCSIGLVPTMGYLHEGHLSLVRAARARGHQVVMSIFVNPLQFGPREDFDRYPRDLDRDTALAAEAGVDLLFAPPVREMYPQEPVVTVKAGALAERLCGASRPGHFDGVVTVVAKLFHITQPDEAFFGEKDFQQLRIVQRMTADLNFPVEVVGCPTVREADGLAMSSRNQYLTAAQRAQAAALPRALAHARERCERDGERDARTLIREVSEELSSAGIKIDYVSVVRDDNLEPVEQIDRPCRLMAAVWVGQTRLIDNVAIDAAAAGANCPEHRGQHPEAAVPGVPLR
ncbi:MAG: pantoate--beta-alanine ligase [Alicyclobacillaceae bacterium]|nr:pantoate--beta-alanine ligase [Alicyclobacillaceae bacterium]